jgi:hypothetical protein
MSKRAYYSDDLSSFLNKADDAIIGELTKHHAQDLKHLQTNAWIEQLKILKENFKDLESGFICLEMLIPRMGKRADAILVFKHIIFVLEFKIGELEFKSTDCAQVEGYALDLSNFHETSHSQKIVPILIASNAKDSSNNVTSNASAVLPTLKTNAKNLCSIINECISTLPAHPPINPITWFNGHYKPTPTIIEAAQALYANHDVTDIARSDADAVNIAETVGKLDEIIHFSRTHNKKSICFVTGVPGAGKTLVGLHIATNHNNPDDSEHVVFLSGNGPLVEVLREALAKDKVSQNGTFKLSDARRETASFIQNIHHFRDDALIDKQKAPNEKVVIFDEAQRAWNENKTSTFMRQKKGQKDFQQSEPEFLISVMDRHQDWCVIIALIGGGQEINDGEAGINGWFNALDKHFSNWNIYFSSKLDQKEYAGNDADISLIHSQRAKLELNLHLSTSMRAFRAKNLSHFVHYLINNQPQIAYEIFTQISANYPIFITRNFKKAKDWVKFKVRGLDSSGLLASSGAKRLRAEGIFVSNDVKAAEWFLNKPNDVRSSHFLESVGTEFLVQGLELDWCLVAWDADLRYENNAFQHWSFKGSKWQKINKSIDKQYLENSYRVLLTRARQGMILYIPQGNDNDATRQQHYYNGTFEYLKKCGIKELD